VTSVQDFMNAAPVRPAAGNTQWAAAYSAELRRVVHTHAAQAPRSLQVHLGPSELGTPCDRQVAAKMARVPSTNHVMDPWPSVVGTAVHAWLADAFAAENDRLDRIRWVPEQRVVPHPDHSGTADLYDADEEAVVDHKVLGPTSLDKVRSPQGPPRHYVVQLLLYALGYRNLGLPVRRVALAAYPRTKATLDELYVWERPYTLADDELIAEVFAQTEYRRQWAVALLTGAATLNDVPATPSDSCVWCPVYRPSAAYDGGSGCPGQVASRT
jgi:hypothetical protein